MMESEMRSVPRADPEAVTMDAFIRIVVFPISGFLVEFPEPQHKHAPECLSEYAAAHFG